jgi:2-polyprenyl-6-methoxyphenol hydroxylase-like FAD-dependent oxidoreductase
VSTAHPSEQHDLIPVLVVGGGPVGTALALELALRGHRPVVIEQREQIEHNHPRGGNNTMRTVEQYRRWGISSALRQAAISIRSQENAALTPSAGSKILFASSILGESLGVHGFDWGRMAEQYQTIACEPSVSVNQPRALEILRQRAIELGVEFLLGWELVALEQSAERVEVQIRHHDGVQARALQARYLVGCDGAYGQVRQWLGIQRDGVGEPNHFATMCIVRLKQQRNAELFASLRYRMEGFLVVTNPQIVSNASPVDDERWRFTLSDFDHGRPATREEVHAAALALFGETVDLEVETVSSYRIQVRIARQYRQGRAFIAGDAAHLFPPAGGHNQNLGIGDAVNLGWKLAAVLDGWAGDGLLDSYDEERRPSAWRVGQSSWYNYNAMSQARALVQASGIPLGRDEESVQTRQALGEHIYRLTQRQWKTHGVVLDVRYEASSVVVDDGSVAPEWQPTEYHPFAKPGHRAPHLTLADGGVLYDLLGLGFSLLVLDDGCSTQAQALLASAQRLDIPLQRVALVAEAGARALYGAGLVLVRPDQQVAWRGERVDDAEALLLTITGQVADKRATTQVA